jgi:tRNA wybutosine-synthesizing protein 2
MLYLRINKRDAEEKRKYLLDRELLHPEFSIFSDENFVYFPVKFKFDNSNDFVDIDGKIRIRKKKPYDEIIENVKIDNDLKKFIPNHWEKYGNVVLIQLPEVLYNYRLEIGATFAKVLRAKSVLLYKGIEGEFRRPRVEFIYGDDALTIHIENGIYYKFDASRIMFSSGNVDERIRMSKMDATGEKIVDMFAGIGYFSIPLAKYSYPARLIAIEKNEESYNFLIENIKLNNVSIDPMLSDNRDVELKDYADRVIMGYVHSREFIPYAIKMLKHKGIIHYHDTWRKEEVWNREEVIKNLFGDLQYYVMRFHIVKNYAPNIMHVNIDLRIRKV